MLLSKSVRKSVRKMVRKHAQNITGILRKMLSLSMFLSKSVQYFELSFGQGFQYTLKVTYLKRAFSSIFQYKTFIYTNIIRFLYLFLPIVSLPLGMGIIIQCFKYENICLLLHVCYYINQYFSIKHSYTQILLDFFISSCQ